MVTAHLVIWKSTARPAEGPDDSPPLFVELSPGFLAQLCKRLPQHDEILGRLGAGGPGIGAEEVPHLVELLDELWDRCQAEHAERIVRSGVLPPDPDRAPRELARLLRRAVADDPFLATLDEALELVVRCREEGTGLAVDDL